jgi:hypothetical protein
VSVRLCALTDATFARRDAYGSSTVGVLAGGGAYAASKIGTQEIENKAITAKKIDSGAVKAGKLAAAAVGTTQLDINAAGVALAGAEIGPNGELVSWFNRLGDGPPVVEHPLTGEWLLNFPGLSLRSYPFVGAVSIVGDNGGAIGDPGIATTRMATICGGDPCVNQPLVNTFDPDGNPTDLGFNYVMFGSGPQFPQFAPKPQAHR